MQAERRRPGGQTWPIRSTSVQCITTDVLSEEFMTRDGANVDSIEWDQKKSFSYIYQ